MSEFIASCTPNLKCMTLFEEGYFAAMEWLLPETEEDDEGNEIKAYEPVRFSRSLIKYTLAACRDFRRANRADLLIYEHENALQHEKRRHRLLALAQRSWRWFLRPWAASRV